METDNRELVTDSGDSKDSNNEYEECVCCYRRLSILKCKEIEFRPFYIEGAGQLCYDCYHELYVGNRV